MAQPTFQIVDRPSTIHGVGRFTTNWITRGTVIHSEQPFFRLRATEFTFPPEAPHDPRWNTWVNLPLHEPTPPATGHGALYDRFRATSLRCGTYRRGTDYADAAASGVFLLAARFNSSCQPNVQAHWVPTDERMHFLALRDIAPDEELCICYDPPTLLYSKVEREQRLSSRFGFSCNCIPCSQDSPNSDSRRTALRGMIEEGVPNSPREVSHNPSIRNDQADEGIVLNRINQITGAIHDLHAENLYTYADTLHFDLHLAQRRAGNNNNAMLCLLTARNLARAMVGNNDERVNNMTGLLPPNLQTDYSMDCRAGCC